MQFLHVHFKCDFFFFLLLFLLLSQGRCPILCFPEESVTVAPNRASQLNHIFLQQLVVGLVFFFLSFFLVKMTFWEIFE